MISMAMRRYPFEEMERMMEQIRRSMWDSGADRPILGGERRDVNLSLDTDDEGYVLLADMPGFEKEEIDLRFDDGVVSIEASHKRDEGDDSIARRHTRYVREQVQVGDVIAKEITATYRNGVLEVHLPARGEAVDERSRIDID